VNFRSALFVAALVLLQACGRVDDFRLAHANDATTAVWPPGTPRIEMSLVSAGTGQAWVGVSVDGSAPVPFLLYNGAAAVAVTGARLPRELPEVIGRMTDVEALLPGISGGRLVQNRRLGVGPLQFLEQGLLIVDTSDWPHRRPGGGAAGVIGYDLFRRFPVEIDPAAGRAWLMKAGGAEVALYDEVMRLAVLDRRPYLEVERAGDGGQDWVRLQLELGWPGGACLDESGPGGRIVLPGDDLEIEGEPCDPSRLPADPVARRDGVLGFGALQGRRLLVDYPGGRAIFRPSP